MGVGAVLACQGVKSVSNFPVCVCSSVLLLYDAGICQPLTPQDMTFRQEPPNLGFTNFKNLFVANSSWAVVLRFYTFCACFFREEVAVLFEGTRQIEKRCLLTLPFLFSGRSAGGAHLPLVHFNPTFLVGFSHGGGGTAAAAAWLDESPAVKTDDDSAKGLIGYDS